MLRASATEKDIHIHLVGGADFACPTVVVAAISHPLVIQPLILLGPPLPSRLLDLDSLKITHLDHTKHHIDSEWAKIASLIEYRLAGLREECSSALTPTARPESEPFRPQNALNEPRNTVGLV